MNILGPLSKTKTGNKLIVVMAERYSKLTCANPTKKTIVADMARIFVEDWVILYGISDQSLMDNNPQFVGKFFCSVCIGLGTKLLTTTAHHPQTSGQSERYNKTILNQLRHYIGEHQDHWDTFAQPLDYAYNAQTHVLTKTTSFSLALTREPPAAFGLPQPYYVSPQTKKRMLSRELQNVLLDRDGLIRARVVTALSRAQQKYKTNFDKHVKLVRAFAKDDLVYLDKRAPATSTKANDMSRKLQEKKAVVYRIVKAQPKASTVERDGILDTGSIDRILIAQCRDETLPNSPNES